MKYLNVKRILSAVLASMMVISVLYVVSPEKQASADTGNVAATAGTSAMNKSTTDSLGSAANPFTILEIVPNQSMAKMGYLIPGCEPIDMNRLITDKNGLIGTYNTLFCQPDSGMAAFTAQTTDLFLDQLLSQNTSGVTVDAYDAALFGGAQPAGMTVNSALSAQVSGVWHMKNTPLTQTGYYQLTDAGSGSFTLAMSTDGKTGTFTYTGAGNGNYNWVQAENTDNLPTDYNATTVWTVRTGTGYYEFLQYQITNQDQLVKTVYQTASDNFRSQVITLTPAEMGSAEALKLIDTADMIVIQADGDPGITSLWNAYHKEGATAGTDTDFSKTDLPGAAAIEIIKRQAGRVGTAPAAMILDQKHMMPSSTAANNFSKLYMALMQYGPNVFYQNFMNDATAANNVSVNTAGQLVYKSTSTWTQTTFSTSLGTIAMQFSTLPTNAAIITDYIYSYYGTGILPGNLLTSGIANAAAVSPLFTYLTVTNSDGSTSTPATASSMQAVNFILQTKNYKTSLKILEIEACNAFYADDSDWKLRLSALVPWFSKDITGSSSAVTVIKMPVWELNGNIDDLNSTYDMILIGDKQNTTNGSGGYNDTSMGNMIYTHLGDLTSPGTKISSGAYKGSYSTGSNARYSANDITVKKMHELTDYVGGGKPLIFLGNLYTANGVIDTTKVDVSSNLYKILGLRSGKSVYAQSLDSSRNFVNKTAVQSCKIEFYTADGGTGYPTVYAYDAASDGTITNTRYYGSSTFSYHFKVNGPAGAQYQVKLFLDQDGDGVYDGSQKEVNRQKALGITTTAAEEVTGLSIVRDSDQASVSVIDANTYYTVSRTLPSKFVGILPWKLEVTNTASTSVRDSSINYTVIQAKDSQKEKINILQMNLTQTMTSEAASNFINFSDTSSTTGARFAKYLACIPEFNISLTYQKNTNWYKKYGSGAKDSLGNTLTEAQRIAAWKQELDTYDMLILGFKDVATLTNDKVFYEGFKYFKNQGKSIIMSHDMVISADVLASSTNYYYSSIADVRSMVGQRKRYTDSGGNLSYAQAMLAGNLVNLLPTSTSYLNSSITVGGVAYNPYMTTTLNGSAASATEYPDNANYLHKNSLSPAPSGKSDRVTTTSSYGWTSSFTTNYVGVANHGQITEYPYKIPDAISVQTTHTQYFSLDMDETADGDAVVWYNLTDNRSSRYSGTLNNTTTDNKGTYSSRETDSANNFYIYNKGNITYTGLGHMANSQPLTDDEVKLFVNTMIAAYRSTADKPSIQMTNKDASTSNNNETILYVTLDNANISSSGKTIPVTYTVKDDSFSDVPNRTYQMQYLTTSGTASDLGTYVNSSGAAVAYTDNSYYSLARGTEYRFNVPYQTIIDQGQVEYDLTLTSSYVNNWNQTITTVSTKRVIILPMPLFKLD